MSNSGVSRPAFLITVDTEGDNLWARDKEITTRNSRYLPRFQACCEKYGLKPTYLTNWEMTQCPVFVEFGREVLKRGTAEIGMHLHAWNSPPLVPLTEDDNQHHPYLIEYAEEQVREKVRVMTRTLEDTFGLKMISHRAGRWSFNEVYARALVDHGYKVDCSVTPRMSWKPYKGDPRGQGGTDYTNFPENAYFMDERDISRPGNSPLLEVPVTVMPPHFPAPLRLARSALEMEKRIGARAARRLLPRKASLIPRADNGRLMRRVVEAARREGRDYVEFATHSSEVMPGGSPTFPTERSIEKLYDDLHALFESAARTFQGLTLSDYYNRFTAKAPSRVTTGPRLGAVEPAGVGGDNGIAGRTVPGGRTAVL
jgi:hypothetical protein